MARIGVEFVEQSTPISLYHPLMYRLVKKIRELTRYSYSVLEVLDNYRVNHPLHLPLCLPFNPFKDPQFNRFQEGSQEVRESD